MPPSRHARAERLGPYFEAQLRLAGRMAELTGAPLGEMALRHTNLHRRLGFGVPGEAPAAGWSEYAEGLEAAPDLAGQLASTRIAFLAAAEERLPLPGQVQFGCFAYEPPGEDGGARVHFNNVDTDADGGPLAAVKADRRRDELAAMARHIREAHPEATCIRGKSWLYNLKAYRRLFPPQYAASRVVAPGPLRLSGTSSWGQLIDSREAIRPDVRDALLRTWPTSIPTRPGWPSR